MLGLGLSTQAALGKKEPSPITIDFCLWLHRNFDVLVEEINRLQELGVL